jgi:tRNA pseudouridine38-40 synthase
MTYRYKISIEYEGTGYSGWQKQPNAKSIQGEVEKSLQQFSQEKVVTHGMGRTDAGVHAIAQIAHFDLEKEWDPDTVLQGINYFLKPQPIVITVCEIVSNDFHARHSAKNRTYQYVILNRFSNPALDKNRAWHVSKKLDVQKMEEASKILIGKHDFTSFRTTLCEAKSPIKTIEYIHFNTEGERITIEICAESFLHHMVRNIVGFLELVGSSKKTTKDLQEYLEANDVHVIKYTAPSCGLYFTKVEY